MQISRTNSNPFAAAVSYKNAYTSSVQALAPINQTGFLPQFDAAPVSSSASQFAATAPGNSASQMMMSMMSQMMMMMISLIESLVGALATKKAASTPKKKTGASRDIQSDAPGVGDGKSFQTQGGKIVGPDGSTFVPKGMNYKIGDSLWNSIDTGKLKSQGFNTLRVQATLDKLNDPASQQQLDDLIQRASKDGMVVQITFRDGRNGGGGNILTGDDLKQAEAAMGKMADKYKDNPYVWYNTVNESGQGDANSADWFNEQMGIIDAIRGTGNNNPIIVDDTNWGQGNTRGSGNNSGLLVHAKEFLAKGNVMGSVHIYNPGDQATAESQITKGITDLQDQGMAVMIGEYGQASWNNGDGPPQDTTTGFHAAINVIKKLNLGSAVWSDSYDYSAGKASNDILSSKYANDILQLNQDVG